eukprot:scaffold10709_cov130-Skeletonema_marinoi.AAC.8
MQSISRHPTFPTLLQPCRYAATWNASSVSSSIITIHYAESIATLRRSRQIAVVSQYPNSHDGANPP